MKTFRLRCKKLCAVVLMIVTAFGFSFATPKTAQAANTKYWIKVNKQANVATVYQLKNGTYKPIKAFLVSCGGANTPAGTFYTPAKYRWQTLMGPSYGQYCTRVHGGVLFHSVWYYEKNPSTQSTVQFNKLGQTASHGCIRLSVGDAKWIYDNCALGTKVTVYSSSNPGPLGKPKGIKVSTARRQYWDPTDPSKKNPYRKQKATLTVAKKKAKTAEYGTSYNVKSGVTAKDKITKKSLTKNITYTTTKYVKGKYRKAKFSTKSLGTYRIKYTVKSSLGVKTTKTMVVRVVDTLAPVITAKNRTVKVNTANAVTGVTAKMRSGANRTSAMTVKIKAPGASAYTTYTYAKAKAYKFSKPGQYAVQYSVKNTNKPYRAATKKITITVTGNVNAQINTSAEIVTVPAASTDQTVINAVRAVVTINDNGTVVAGTNTTVTVVLVKDQAGTVTAANVSYKGKNGVTVTKQIKVQFEQATTGTTEQQTTSTERTYLHKPIVSGTVDQIRSEFGKTDTIHIVFMGVDYRPNPPPLFDIEHVDTVLGGAAHDLFAVVRESATEDRVLAGKFGCLGDRVTVARS